MKEKEQMTISELERVSGTPASTIRFYLRERLLPPPERRGRTRAFYGKIHVKRLRDIGKMRDSSGLSIKAIQEKLASSTREDAARVADSDSFDRAGDIMKAAIALFRSRGYGNTSLNDIVEGAKISKGTFYLHFKGKSDLFIKCADMVFYDIDREFSELHDVHDIIEKFRMRAVRFIRKYRHMIDMLNIARGLLGAAPAKNRSALKKIISNLVTPLISDLNEGVDRGLFRTLDMNIFAHMLMGAVEYGIYYLEGKDDAAIEQWIDRSLSLILNGISPPRSVPSDPTRRRS